jgi:hypothetical protein
MMDYCDRGRIYYLRFLKIISSEVKSRATDIINNLVGASSTATLQHCHAACRVFGAGRHPGVRTPSASSTPSSTSTLQQDAPTPVSAAVSSTPAGPSSGAQKVLDEMTLAPKNNVQLS